MKEVKTEQNKDSKVIGEIIEDLYDLKTIKEILAVLYGTAVLVIGFIMLINTLTNNKNISIIITAAILIVSGLIIIILSHYAGLNEKWKAYMLYTNTYNIFSYDETTKTKKKK